MRVQLPKIKAYEVNHTVGKKVVIGHEKEALRVEAKKIASTFTVGRSFSECSRGADERARYI